MKKHFFLPCAMLEQIQSYKDNQAQIGPTLVHQSIKIVTHAIYTYLFFSYTYTLQFCDRCFPWQIRPKTTVQLYILQDYSSVRIGFNTINKQGTAYSIHLVN